MTNDIRDLLAEEALAAEEMADVDVPMVRNRTHAKDPSQVYSLRLPVERIEELRFMATRQSLAPTALLRCWILERLDIELERRQGMETEPIYTLTKTEFGQLFEEFLRSREASMRRYSSH